MLDFIQLLESKHKKNDLELNPLRISKRDVSVVMSNDTLDLHRKLAKKYVTKYNSGEGDKQFNEAGAYLHNIWFDQFREYRPVNMPNGPILTFITKHFGSWGEFKEQFIEEALLIQGSGWIYLSTDGKIKTIFNHEIKTDILILIDMWEHAFVLDYGSDKKKYLTDIWKIIDWNRISTRWGKSL